MHAPAGCGETSRVLFGRADAGPFGEGSRGEEVTHEGKGSSPKAVDVVHPYPVPVRAIYPLNPLQSSEGAENSFRGFASRYAVGRRPHSTVRVRRP